MQASTTRLTFGAILGTVNTTATTISASIGTVGDAVGMLNSYVEKAAREQKIRHKADTNEFKNRLINELSMQRAVQERQVIEFCNDKQNEALFKKAHDELQELLKDN